MRCYNYWDLFDLEYIRTPAVYPGWLDAGLLDAGLLDAGLLNGSVAEWKPGAIGSCGPRWGVAGYRTEELHTGI